MAAGGGSDRGYDVLVVEDGVEVDPGEPGPGQVLLEVRAAGVNPSDWKGVSGQWGTDPTRLPLRVGRVRHRAGRITATADYNALAECDLVVEAVFEDPKVKAEVIQKVEAVIRPQWLRDILHGVPIGHALHPLMILAPAGAWLSAAGLDLVPGTERASRMLVGAGVISALPTAAAGFNDWAQLHSQQQRVGLVHSAANILATTLYAASYLQRRRGKHVSGKVLGFEDAVKSAVGGGRT